VLAETLRDIGGREVGKDADFAFGQAADGARAAFEGDVDGGGFDAEGADVRRAGDDLDGKITNIFSVWPARRSAL
jgi:hypothetical protein